MRLSTKPTQPSDEVGLWGDIFYIKWLSKWLNIHICIWSKTRGKKYLDFNHNLDIEPYNIFFHDEKPLNGYFEPLFKVFSLQSTQQRPKL